MIYDINILTFKLFKSRSMPTASISALWFHSILHINTKYLSLFGISFSYIYYYWLVVVALPHIRYTNPLPPYPYSS